MYNYRDIFDHTADVLCNKFIELDRVVAQSVADQVAETFIDTSAAIKELIKAVAPPSLTDHTHSSEYADSEVRDIPTLIRRPDNFLTCVAILIVSG